MVGRKGPTWQLRGMDASIGTSLTLPHATEIRAASQALR
jgi:hypothetical protein